MAAALRLGLLLFLSPLRAAEPSTELPSNPEAPSKTRATAWKRGRSGPAPLTDGGCQVGWGAARRLARGESLSEPRESLRSLLGS
ncbi:hypothetical protein CIB84_012077 [Bambusicola thoracicus]|uniref:Uncharacterized protein n=1 Tax=Bambusicola thoracicus TaxID=9083 RepID=A0A2P4SJ88_BAMTH|nr:hypothetical protein CIB84_012077 [Bambusicola thoracicus]